MLVALIALSLRLSNTIQFPQHHANSRCRARFQIRLALCRLLVTVHRATPDLKQKVPARRFWAGPMTSIGTNPRNAMDFPFSPVRMIVLNAPETPASDVAVRCATSGGNGLS